ncbi:site-specific integrase [Bacillus xiapuensis]|uniref:Site-specific integrase n=1 Tax=Bacillus xiapuensis TaxID=2014075 RepID=A0ABU6NCB0_9BACI|nr:site-specific integrase [Bacillus xiapuensis]
MSEFYNEVIKNKYLDSMENQGSRETIKYIFIASKRAEEIKGMDMYNFSKEDIEHVMDNLTMKSYHTARANMSYISNYITWCIKQGYRENNLNPLDTVDRKWYSKFVDRTLKIHFSDEEMEDLIEEFDNAQDQAMVQLWYEGAVGTKDFAEIKNLTYYDIDWNNNELELKDSDGSKRKIKVSDRCMRYLQNAHRQQIYINFSIKDGEAVETERELMPSDYIFKNVQSFRTKDAGISTNVIYKRLHALKEKFNLEYLTPNAVKQSGILHMCYLLFMRDGELGKKQFNEVGDQYKWSKISNQGYEYYNVTLLKYFVTKENLKELYDIDVDIDIREVKRK